MCCSNKLRIQTELENPRPLEVKFPNGFLGFAMALRVCIDALNMGEKGKAVNSPRVIF